MFDVIIVGGGPAGLSAALMLGRCRRKVLVFDSSEYRNVYSHALHGFLSRDGVQPMELLRCARDDLRKYKTVEVENHQIVHAVALGRDGFEVTTALGEKYRARKLLLATGVVDHLPDIPGIQEYYGRSVFHCPYCDGWENRDKHLAVLGNGIKGHGLALELTVWSRKITLCTDGPSEVKPVEVAELERNGIAICQERVSSLNGSEGAVTELVFSNGETLECSAIFFTYGQSQRSDLPAMLGCEFTEKGAVKTGKYEATCVPGLYVAGDASEEVQFVATASSEGVQAAFAINTALLKEELK